MNIQQALRKHSETCERIALLEERVQKDFLVSEGRPLYDESKYLGMLAEIDSLRTEGLDMKLRIDTANHKVVGESSISSLLVGRAVVANKLALYQSLKAQNVDSYHYRENKPIPVRRISEVKLDEIIDRLVADRRKIDDKICELNATIQVA